MKRSAEAGDREPAQGFLVVDCSNLSELCLTDMVKKRS